MRGADAQGMRVCDWLTMHLPLPALKSTSYMLRLPPRAAFLKSFARRENLGDLSAKANAQEVVAGMLGMALGIAAASCTADSSLAAFGVYCAGLVASTACSLASVRCLELNTLSWCRARELVRRYVASGCTSVATPRAVNAAETATARLLVPDAGAVPVLYGAPLGETAPSGTALRRLAALYSNQPYLLSLGPHRRAPLAIRISVEDRAGPGDAQLALLQAGLLEAKLAEAGRSSAGEETMWHLVARSYAEAVAELPKFTSAARKAGWNTAAVLWAPPLTADWSPALPAPNDRCPLPAVSMPGRMEEAPEPGVELWVD